MTVGAAGERCGEPAGGGRRRLGSAVGRLISAVVDGRSAVRRAVMLGALSVSREGGCAGVGAVWIAAGVRCSPGDGVCGLAAVRRVQAVGVARMPRGRTDLATACVESVRRGAMLERSGIGGAVQLAAWLADRRAVDAVSIAG